MAHTSDDFDEVFVTEFPKQDVGAVEYLQGRVSFALFDQMIFMNKLEMTQSQIRDTVIGNVTNIIDGFEIEQKLENP